MRHTMVTYTVKPGREEENAALVRAMFEELAETRPAGLRYAVFYLPDSRQFIHLYTDEGSTSGVQGLDSFKAFVAGAEDRHEQPATFTQPELHRRLPHLRRVTAQHPPAGVHVQRPPADLHGPCPIKQENSSHAQAHRIDTRVSRRCHRFPG